MFTYLLDDGVLLVEALLRAGLELAAGRAAQLAGHLLTLRLGRVLLHVRLLGVAHLLGPLGALLLGGVALGDVLALLLLFRLAVDDVVLDLVLVVARLALRLVHGLALLGALALADERRVAEPDGLFLRHLLVLDEAALLEVLLALLLLLGLEVGGVGGVAPLGVAVVALDVLVVLGLLHHDDLVDAALAGGGDRADVEGGAVVGGSLGGGGGGRGALAGGAGAVSLLMGLGRGGVVGSAHLAAGAGLVERERVHQRLGLPLLGGGRAGHQQQQTNLPESNELKVIPG